MSTQMQNKPARKSQLSPARANQSLQIAIASNDLFGSRNSPNEQIILVYIFKTNEEYSAFHTAYSCFDVSNVERKAQ